MYKILLPVPALCTDSNSGINQYGPNPKGIGNHDEVDEIGSYLPN